MHADRTLPISQPPNSYGCHCGDEREALLTSKNHTKYHLAMSPSDSSSVHAAANGELELSLGFDDSISQAAVSTALVSVFRGKFCDAILPNRRIITFKKKEVLYELGDKERTFFFLQNGFVKVGTVTSDGHELIYDVRKGGDVVGELCASESRRADRAVALEQTDAIPVPFEDVMEAVRKQPGLLARLVDVFCRALNEAYAQVNTLAVDDTVHRLNKVLLKLAEKIGQCPGPEIEIPTYLTQEEIAQMVGARRERISTALNFFRRKRMIRYTSHGHLVLDVKALESYSA